MKTIFTTGLLAVLLSVSFNSFGQTCAATATNPNPTPGFGTALAVTISNGFTQNSGTVGTIPVSSTRTVTSPIYFYTAAQTTVYFKYNLVTDGNKSTTVTSYSIKINLDGGSVLTCNSGTVSLNVPSGSAGTDYYFSISGVSLPQNKNFAIALTLTVASSNGTTNNVLLSAFQSNANLAPAGAVLPVKFSGINIKSDGGNAKLTWNVATELNVSAYEVQRSSDASNFSTVGSLPASGKASYSFMDTKTPAGKVFYRVKSIDLDGLYCYSPVVELNTGSGAVVLKVFPLPAQNQVTIQHPAATNITKLSLNAEDGRIIRLMVPPQGAVQTTLDLSALKPGLYLLRLDDGLGNSETIKIVKQ